MTEQTKCIHERIMAGTGERGDGDFRFDDAQDEAKSRWLPTILCTAAGIIAMIISAAGLLLWQFPVFAESIAQAQTQPQPPAQPPAKKAQQAPAKQQQPAAKPAATPEEPADPFLAHASQTGAKTCAATYAGLGKALTGGTQFTVQTQTARSDVDRHAVQGIVGMTFQSSVDGGYSGPAAGFVFAAPMGLGCEGAMIRVVPFAQNCQTAATFLPNGSQPQQPLSGLQVFALATGGQALLLPTGNGCVAISIVRS